MHHFLRHLFGHRRGARCGIVAAICVTANAAFACNTPAPARVSVQACAPVARTLAAQTVMPVVMQPAVVERLVAVMQPVVQPMAVTCNCAPTVAVQQPTPAPLLTAPPPVAVQAPVVAAPQAVATEAVAVQAVAVKKGFLARLGEKLDERRAERDAKKLTLVATTQQVAVQQVQAVAPVCAPSPRRARLFGCL